jgi:hypothetical protein
VKPFAVWDDFPQHRVMEEAPALEAPSADALRADALAENQRHAIR